MTQALNTSMASHAKVTAVYGHFYALSLLISAQRVKNFSTLLEHLRLWERNSLVSLDSDDKKPNKSSHWLSRPHFNAATSHVTVQAPSWCLIIALNTSSAARLAIFPSLLQSNLIKGFKASRIQLCSGIWCRAGRNSSNKDVVGLSLQTRYTEWWWAFGQNEITRGKRAYQLRL